MVATATDRRRRQVRWAKRARRLGLAWGNALEIARTGRLTAPYGAPFEVVHTDPIYRLRRYARPHAAVRAPLLLVPPLMVASEIYDISPDTSAVALLARAGVDVWLTDFGAPEREAGGLTRTLDDHVRAVANAIDHVRTATGFDVHVAGYSQGGMFAYQAAAFRSREGRAAGIASVITFGSPVDMHRQLGVDSDTNERLLAGLRTLIAWPLEHLDAVPGFITATGFKLIAARKELAQLVEFVKNLHDRKALEQREAKRLFLGGQGFVAWPGPALRKMIDEVIVGNRMASGGLVVDGHSITLADLTCPILYFVGSRDEMGRPAVVRGIRRAAPHASAIYEVPLRAGHFGLVVGHTASDITWPTVIQWMRWRERAGEVPAAAIDVRAAPGFVGFPGDRAAAGDGDSEDDDADDDHQESAFELARELAGKTAKAALDRATELTEDLSGYLSHARWQLPRLQRLRGLRDDTLISASRTLAEQAKDIGDKTFFLFRGRAFTYADANRRVDAVVRGLIASGVRVGQRVGVMMKSRPSHLSVVTALGRIGAVAVLMSPALPEAILPRALALGEVELFIVDPDGAARARAATVLPVLVLGGVGEVPWQPGASRALPAGVVDLEKVDPDAVALPSWYKPDPGRAADLAMLFLTAQGSELRAQRITHRRWAFSALGAAAATTLNARDTVYCCLPLHHPSGTLVAVGSALIGGTRLALASEFAAATFWDEVRRYGATVVFYAGDMCRRLVDAPLAMGERNHPVRLFAGSGMRVDVWNRLSERFGAGFAIVELYASTEAHVVLANAAGAKVGSVGKPLPGSPDVAIAAWDFTNEEFVRDGRGHLVPARTDEPGMLIARMSARAGADVAHIDPRRLIRDSFARGDTWFSTGDLFRVDAAGDYWFVERQGQTIATRQGAVAATRIEDAMLASGAISACAALPKPDPDDPAFRVAVAAIQPRGDAGTIDWAALSRAVLALPEYARPQLVRVVAQVPMTEGFRPIRAALADLDFAAAGAHAWDAHAQRYVEARR